MIALNKKSEVVVGEAASPVRDGRSLIAGEGLLRGCRRAVVWAVLLTQVVLHPVVSLAQAQVQGQAQGQAQVSTQVVPVNVGQQQFSSQQSGLQQASVQQVLNRNTNVAPARGGSAVNTPVNTQVNHQVNTPQTVNPKTSTNAAPTQVNNQVSTAVNTQVAMELAVRKLVKDAAQAEGFANRPDVQQKTREAATEILVDAYLSEKARTAEVSDAQARQEYDAIVAAMAPQDLQLRLIAVSSAEKNAAVAGMFKRGAKFEDVAAQHSEVGSKSNGGLLPWLNLKEPVADAGAYGLPAEVVKVALALPKGQQSKSATVVDGVSYYVKVEDKRKANVAPFEKVKGDLKQRLEDQSQQQKVREVVAKLIEQKKAAPAK